MAGEAVEDVVEAGVIGEAEYPRAFFTRGLALRGRLGSPRVTAHSTETDCQPRPGNTGCWLLALGAYL